MSNSVEQAVVRAIETMRHKYSEPLTIDDLARAAMFSKFHFSRLFQRTTGVSPGRFLSAIRLAAAKQLLTSTSLSVADISLRVGYSSVGTFSTRFTRSVGLSPTSYRRLGGYAPHIATEAPRGDQRAVVRGHVHAAPGPDRPLVFLGLFPHRIPEGRPVRCAVLTRPGPFRFGDLPAGTWYLLGHSVSGNLHSVHHDRVAVATEGPITTRADQVTPVDVRLEPVSTLDPPVLLALLDARRTALERTGADEGALAA